MAALEVSPRLLRTGSTVVIALKVATQAPATGWYGW
jgi:hypothetical protein